MNSKQRRSVRRAHINRHKTIWGAWYFDLFGSTHAVGQTTFADVCFVSKKTRKLTWFLIETVAQDICNKVSELIYKNHANDYSPIKDWSVEFQKCFEEHGPFETMESIQPIDSNPRYNYFHVIVAEPHLTAETIKHIIEQYIEMGEPVYKTGDVKYKFEIKDLRGPTLEFNAKSKLF